MIEKDISFNIEKNLKSILLEKIEKATPEQMEEFINSTSKNELIAAIKEDLKLIIVNSVKKGHLQIVQLCLDNNQGEIDLNYVSKGYLQDTLLNNAVIGNHIEIARLLIAYGADVNLIGERAMPPLFQANTKEMVELLVKNGANLNYVYCGEYQQSILSHFLEMLNSERKEIIEYLLQSGAKIDEDIGLDTLLHRAVNNLEDSNLEDKDTIDIIEILLRNNADVNARDGHSGYAPLHYAAENPYGKEMAEILLNYGADVDIKDNNGSSPLDLAFEKGNYELFKLLILHGAKAHCNPSILDETTAEQKALKIKFIKMQGFITTAEALFDKDYAGLDEDAHDQEDYEEEKKENYNSNVLQILKSYFKLKGIPSGWEYFMKGLPVADQLKPWFDEIKKEVEQTMQELNELISPFIAGMLHSRFPINFPTPCPTSMFDCDLARNGRQDNKRKFEFTLKSYRELPQYLQPGKFPTDLEKEDNFKNFIHQIILSNQPLNMMIQNLERILITNIFYKQDRDNLISVLNAFKNPQPYFVDAIRELNETIKENASMSSQQRDEQIEKRKLEEVARDHSQNIKRFFPIAKRVKTSEFVDRIKAERDKGKEKEI
ncbi:pfs, nacht and ankyrin domain protein [endosymbiont of Acanthamoeba sp. UWC8]|uniref:ankyrin repeat domain-containing protein n=1 Tax=endosymbiont of Acanthamoeba sp. UWC8 TaxID=86106 RepID=UPI0004D18C9C|nr:ankyrin repeat domain-containing protein [endosymbiont of Acanthamoeba sp. UWC8]AIF80630.1 pfs, nacht and ankyrin domain protein [endosymbiont of Acanthamoeba sp. UWC8]